MLRTGWTGSLETRWTCRPSPFDLFPKPSLRPATEGGPLITGIASAVAAALGGSVSLVEGFCAESPPYHRRLLLDEAAGRRSGSAAFEFDTENVVLDFEAGTATVQDVLSESSSENRAAAELPRQSGLLRRRRVCRGWADTSCSAIRRLLKQVPKGSRASAGRRTDPR